MRAQWTAQLIGTMHLYGITQIQLAEKLQVTAEYVNMVLNGRRSPKSAEVKFGKAVEDLIKKIPQEKGRK